MSDTRDFGEIASEAVSAIRFNAVMTPSKALVKVAAIRAALDRIEARANEANRSEATR